jgi:hypothetical protein
VVKEAKAEGESVKTEAMEHKAAARHHHAAKCTCGAKHAHKAHKSAHKTAAKKSTTDTTKTSS